MLVMPAQFFVCANSETRCIEVCCAKSFVFRFSSSRSFCKVRGMHCVQEERSIREHRIQSIDRALHALWQDALSIRPVPSMNIKMRFNAEGFWRLAMRRVQGDLQS